MSYLKISILLLFASQTACFIDTKVTEFNEMICKKDKDCFNGMLCVEPYGKCRVPNRCVASENGHTRAVSNGNSCFVESGEEGICLEGACVSSICGDGYADPKKGEKCDDGDTINENACTNTCAVAVCGDGIVFAGVEVCDGPQCNANCEKKQICGDGVLDDNEQCDDSNRNSNDACDLDCKIVSWKSQLITGYGENQNNPHNIVWPSLIDLVYDLNDNLYILDFFDGVVRKLSPNGDIITVVGNNGEGYSGDGGPGFSAQLSSPQSLFVNTFGEVYIADRGNEVIRKLDNNGQITTFLSKDMIHWKESQQDLKNTFAPTYLKIDSNDQIILSNSTNILKITADRQVEEILSLDARMPINGDGIFGLPGITRFQKVGEDYFVLAEGIMLRFRGDDSCVIGEFIPEEEESDTFDGFEDDDVPSMSLKEWQLQIGFCPEYHYNVGSNITIRGMYVLENGDILFSDTTKGRIFIMQANMGLIHIAGKLGFDSGDSFEQDLIPALEDYLLGPTQITLSNEGAITFLDVFTYAVKQIDQNMMTKKLTSWSSFGTVEHGRPVFNIDLEGLTELQLFNDSLYLLKNNFLGMIKDGVFESLVGSNQGGRFYQTGDYAPLVRFPYISSFTRTKEGIIYLAESDFIIEIDGEGIIRNLESGYELTENEEPLFLYNIISTSYGSLYAVDYQNNQLLEFGLDGRFIKRITGGVGKTNMNVDILAEDALIGPIFSLVEHQGEIYFIDSLMNSIKKIDRFGYMRLVAGQNLPESYGYAGDGDLAIGATLNSPKSLAFDAAGNLYFADYGNSVIRMIDQQGYISTVFGANGATSLGDGGLASKAAIDFPTNFMIDSQGTMYLKELSGNLRVIDQNGFIRSYAGSFAKVNDGQLKSADLGGASSMLMLDNGHILVASGIEGLVRKVDLDKNKVCSVVGYPAYHLDEDSKNVIVEKSRYSRELNNAAGIIYVDSRDSFWISEAEGNTIREVKMNGSTESKDWSIETIGGTRSLETCCSKLESPEECLQKQPIPMGCEKLPSLFTDDVFLKYARFNKPTAMVYDRDRDVVYIADTNNNVIRKVDIFTMKVTTILGVPQQSGDLGSTSVAADQARLYHPQGLAIAYGTNGSAHSLYVADTDNHKVRRLDLSTQIMSIVLGDGDASSSGRGKPAMYFPVDHPKGLAVDKDGNLFVSSRTTIREVFSGENGIAEGQDTVETIYGLDLQKGLLEESTYCLSGLYMDERTENSELYALDECRGYLFKVFKN